MRPRSYPSLLSSRPHHAHLLFNHAHIPPLPLYSGPHLVFLLFPHANHAHLLFPHAQTTLISSFLTPNSSPRTVKPPPIRLYLANILSTLDLTTSFLYAHSPASFSSLPHPQGSMTTHTLTHTSTTTTTTTTEQRHLRA